MAQLSVHDAVVGEDKLNVKNLLQDGEPVMIQTSRGLRPRLDIEVRRSRTPDIETSWWKVDEVDDKGEQVSRKLSDEEIWDFFEDCSGERRSPAEPPAARSRPWSSVSRRLRRANRRFISRPSVRPGAPLRCGTFSENKLMSRQ